MLVEYDLDRASMFSRIASRYDRINRVISAGLDLSWREALLRHLPNPWTPRGVLDVCCGTGVLLAMLRQRFPSARAVGLDFAPGMLRKAEERLARFKRGRPALVLGDQKSLPFGDGEFELVTNAFGLRNAEDIEQSVAEMDRVLARGGIMAILELTRPRRDPWGRLFSVYFNRLAPMLAHMLGGERVAYVYLSDSVAGFLNREETARRIESITHSPVALVPLFGSVVTLFLLKKTAVPPDR